MTVEFYSRHLCSPFLGVLQVVATDSARALSFSGLSWEDDSSADLDTRYLTRLAPRLLVLQHLNEVTRRRLENMACANALAVDEHMHLHPEIIDREKITLLRVEASLRRAAK